MRSFAAGFRSESGEKWRSAGGDGGNATRMRSLLTKCCLVGQCRRIPNTPRISMRRPSRQSTPYGKCALYSREVATSCEFARRHTATLAMLLLYKGAFERQYGARGKALPCCRQDSFHKQPLVAHWCVIRVRRYARAVVSYFSLALVFHVLVEELTHPRRSGLYVFFGRGAKFVVRLSN